MKKEIGNDEKECSCNGPGSDHGSWADRLRQQLQRLRQAPARPPAPPARMDASASAPAVDKLVLGTSADYPPFEFHVLQDGEDKIVGIDVFLAEQIAEDMGAEFEVVHMDFNNLFTLLNQGQCDM